MNFPAELKYSKSHEWLKEEDGVSVIGISDFAQDALGDVVFVNLPEVGDDAAAGEAFGDVESVKAVSDLISPVSGTVCEVNEDLLDQPELLNEDPYGSSRWRTSPTPKNCWTLPHMRRSVRRRADLWAVMSRPPKKNGEKCSRPSA